ncbi:hypothetical protein [Amaricoccus macauensis]|uniref:hypothetical protein n=1 Tax=Amaricoccus macauensis TaxID=57001 RepID=UPI003C7B7461
MTPLMLFFVACGIGATLLFVAGYLRGVRVALRSCNDDRIETDTSGDLTAYWWKIGIGVLAASALIFLAGTSPIFVYAAPFMAIMTAAANGLAFFVEKLPEDWE